MIEPKPRIPSECMSIYSEINTHMITALMLHDQMADLYDFLNLHGFKRMHEYQHIAESLERRKLKRYVLNHHNKLVMDENVDNPKVIPTEWYGYSRYDVSPQVRVQSLSKSFQRYRDWETLTKNKLCSASKMMFDLGYIADYEFVSELLKDVDVELKYLEWLDLKLKACDYDIQYVLEIQDELHEFYKEKMEKLYE